MVHGDTLTAPWSVLSAAAVVYVAHGTVTDACIADSGCVSRPEPAFDCVATGAGSEPATP